MKMNKEQDILLKEGKMLPVMEHFTLYKEKVLIQGRPHISFA